MPAIHLRREEIGELFHAAARHAGRASTTRRAHRGARGATCATRFLARARPASPASNFAIAETGGIVVCTNEGNADLGIALPPLHIACVGIEKLIPRAADLGVFLRLLARSATGQAITAYTSHFHGPRARRRAAHRARGQRPQRAARATRRSRDALACIRCGACLNTCPVYRRSGGHSYGTTVAGPIGSVLAPARDPARHASLPFACSLCGSCRDVCPVRIDLPAQLVALRGTLRARAGGCAAGSRCARPPPCSRGRRSTARRARSRAACSRAARGARGGAGVGARARAARSSRRELPRAVAAPWPVAATRSSPRWAARAGRPSRSRRHAAPGRGAGPRARLRARPRRGGRALPARCEGPAGLDAALAALPAFAGARRVWSSLPGLRLATVDPAALADPHDLAGLDVALLPGDFGVAESGAVWVDAPGAARARGALPRRARRPGRAGARRSSPTCTPPTRASASRGRASAASSPAPPRPPTSSRRS